MKYPKNIEKIAELKPQYLGLIFYSKSPRHFEGAIPSIDPAIKKTGVFVNAPLSEVIVIAKKHQLQALQLHGEETPQYCSNLRKAFGEKPVEIIKVFSIDENFSTQFLKPFEDKVNFFLFDTQGTTRGGTGKTFNWDILLNYNSQTPFFLSGGIGLQETEKIKVLINHLEEKGRGNLLYGLDVNSRFETEPGLKDLETLKEFQHELEEILIPTKERN